MSNKFQKCLIGTIILVTLGIVILLELFDGQKKHYQDESIVIPLAPSCKEKKS